MTANETTRDLRAAPDSGGLSPWKTQWQGRKLIYRLLLVPVVVVGFFVLEHFDIRLMQLRYHLVGQEAEGLFKQILFGFRDYAQVVPIVSILILIAIYDRRRKQIILAVLLAQLLAGVGYHGIKGTVVRYRPQVAIEQIAPLDELAIEQTWGGYHFGNHDNKYKSFPSGHTGAAFALTGVLVWFYRRAAVLLWTLAVGCGLSRYFDAVHWLSDCLVGATLGLAGATLALHLIAPLARKRAHTLPTPAPE